MEWGHLSVAEYREWLVTDGSGGYASGTASDILTRRYHGLLVAALAPPLGRRVLLAKLDASVVYDGSSVELGANRWHDGTVAATGFRFITDFRLDGRVPVWKYAIADAVLERRVWMHGASTTFVRYTLARAHSSLAISLKAYVNDRDYHALTHALSVGDVTQIDGSTATIRLGGGTPWHLRVDRGTIRAENEWYYGFLLARESERGLDDVEDHYHGCTIDATLAAGESLTVVASTSQIETFDSQAVLAQVHESERALLGRWRETQPCAAGAPAWIESLVLAANQFIVDRPLNGSPGKTVIAGYHWFGDWGRDTMIALSGLTLTTGRAEIARTILATFARYIDRGMLPNRFPEGGAAPEYNTVDAALWFIEALRQYYAATNDQSLLHDVFDDANGIIDWYARGTRYHIGVDARDGLLYAGEPGVQLTWMDAKLGDWVVTPRIGKPVEINALWYNALRAMDGFAQLLGRDPSRYRELASPVRRSFARYWNDAAGYLYDVLDGPEGNDATIRPNALFAVALPFRALDAKREAAIVDVAARTLVTPCGVRSLSPNDPAYTGHYGGSPRDRDAAYHRGTAWLWLTAIFLRAWRNAGGDAAEALAYLQPFAEMIHTYGVGTLAELTDGDAPYDQRGAIAQAWSVAEILRVWHEVQGDHG
ncbi:MAG: glycogen debranching enzyme family protein [Candidatus Eremiobacteraeota bacterium]|nr:glycogen debranching enzyme family protein [Candidatus Eremiobacteraeota bacterium]